MESGVTVMINKPSKLDQNTVCTDCYYITSDTRCDSIRKIGQTDKSDYHIQKISKLNTIKPFIVEKGIFSSIDDCLSCT